MGQAVGIPDTTNYGELDALQPGQIYDLSIQRHIADRAGEHYDFRIGNDKIHLLSWAIPKAQLPDPGKRVLAVQQPLHEYSYRDFEGEIRSGYGKGTVKLEKLGKVLITDKTPDRIYLTVISDRYPSRYVLLKPQSSKDRDWLLINNTPAKPIDYEKIHMNSLAGEELPAFLDKNRNQKIYASPKIDGAHVLVVIQDGKIEVFSYRISKVHGGNILHTERLFTIRPKTDLPERFDGTILKGELYAVQPDKDGDRVIPVNQLSALLNSSIYRTYNLAKRDNVKFRVGLFDIYRYGKQLIDPETVDYRSRLQMVGEALKGLNPEIFHVVEPVSQPEQILALWDAIKSGKHPLTSEGIVLYPDKGLPLKVKTFQERDVYIREILPGQGKYAGTHAGGFTYSLTPNGPIVGHVGTGFSDDLRKELWENKDDFIGRRARVKFQEQLPSGALRAPVFLALHEDYPNKFEKEGMLPFDDPQWLQAYDMLQELRWHRTMAKLAQNTNDETARLLREILRKPLHGRPLTDVQRLEWLFGGPSALTNFLVWSALGAAAGNLVGYGVSKAMGPDFEGARGRLALLGAIAAGLPALILNLAPSVYAHGYSGILKKTPLQRKIEESFQKEGSLLAQYIGQDMGNICVEISEEERLAIKTAFDIMASKINVDEWGKTVLDDPRLDPWEKTMAVTIPLATSVVKNTSPYVTIGDVVQTTYNMGLGSAFGLVLGRLAQAVLGVGEKTRKAIQRSGEFAGLMKSVLHPVRESAVVVTGNRF